MAQGLVLRSLNLRTTMLPPYREISGSIFKRGCNRIRARQEIREHGEPDDRIAAMTPQRCGAEEARTTESE
jgi:hypothetical protein